MQIVKIKAILQNSSQKYETNVDAYLNIENDTLYYVESDTEKTVVEFDAINQVLRRDNNKMFLEYRFDLKKETDSYIEDKELKQRLSIKVKTNEFIVNEKEIRVNYEIENEQFLFLIQKEDLK